MSKKNRDNKEYVKLEYWIADLTEYNGLIINGNMKILLSMIYSYAANNRVYYESVGTISRRCGCKDEAVRKFRNKMRDAGMIKFVEREGSSHEYYPVVLDESLMVFIDDKKQKKTKSHMSKIEGEKDDDKSGSNLYREQKVVSTLANVTESTDDNTQMNGSDSAGYANLDELQIFDENGVVTEEFINQTDALRNENGTLHSYRYAYALARGEQDDRNGITQKPLNEYMEEAKPEFIPRHLHDPNWMKSDSRGFENQKIDWEELPF